MGMQKIIFFYWGLYNSKLYSCLGCWWTEKDGVMRTVKEEVIIVAARREWALESVPGRLGWLGCRSLDLGWGPAFVWGKAGDSGAGVGGGGMGRPGQGPGEGPTVLPRLALGRIMKSGTVLKTCSESICFLAEALLFRFSTTLCEIRWCNGHDVIRITRP